MPCPDGLPGCTVFHSKYVDDTSSKIRERITEVIQRTTFRVGDHKWTKDLSLSRTSITEQLEAQWVPTTNSIGHPVTVKLYEEWGESWYTNSFTNILWRGSVVTNLLIDSLTISNLSTTNVIHFRDLTDKDLTVELFSKTNARPSQTSPDP